MDETGEIKDTEIARLLSGRIPADEEAPELARFLRDFDATYPEPSIGHCEAAHLSAIFAAAQQSVETESAVARPVTGTPKSAPRAPVLRDSHRSWTGRRFPKWAGVKLAIPIAIILFAFGGVALAGGLVYHEASSTGISTEMTQPGPVDAELDANDQDDSDDAAIEEHEQSDQDDSDDAAIEEHEQSDQDDSDDAAIEEHEQSDQDDSDDAAIEEHEQSDQDDTDDAAIEEHEQSDQDDSDDAAIEEHEQSDAGEYGAE